MASTPLPIVKARRQAGLLLLLSALTTIMAVIGAGAWGYARIPPSQPAPLQSLPQTQQGSGNAQLPDPQSPEPVVPDTPPTPSSDGGGRWIAQLASYPKSGSQAGLDGELRRVRGAVPEAVLLDSDDYGSLRPGFHVAYYGGPFRSGVEALDFCHSRGLTKKNDCLGRYLSSEVTHRDLMCFVDPSIGRTPACYEFGG